MLVLFITLGLGMLVGFFNLMPRRAYRYLDKIMLVILFVLIFNLSLGIGYDEAVFAQLDQLGLKAIVLTIGSVGGSIVGLYIVEKLVFKAVEK